MLLVVSGLIAACIGSKGRAAEPNEAGDWTSESLRHDADIVRLNGLKTLGQLIDEFYEKTGKYPFEGRSIRHSVSVRIASREQEQALLDTGWLDPRLPDVYLTMPLSEFCAELEIGLGRRVTMPFDPENDFIFGVYTYGLGSGVYSLHTCTRNPFPFAFPYRSGDNGVAIGNRPYPKGGSWDYRELMAHPDFVTATTAALHEPERFDRIRRAQERAYAEHQSRMTAREVLARDDFDGRLGLDWKILNPAQDHWSLSRNPGMLTITTQPGAFVRARADYKNVFLVECPTWIAEDFEVTTCLVSFKPKALWHQAGIVLWSDQNNYLKLVYEWGEGPPELALEHQCMFTAAVETGGEAVHSWYHADQQMDRVWLRVRKRMNQYDLLASADGEMFVPLKPMIPSNPPIYNRISWGNGVVKRIGLFAGNGSSSDAGEIDASFDFLEIKAACPD